MVMIATLRWQDPKQLMTLCTEYGSRAVEYGSYVAWTPFLRRLPPGDGHGVLVLPGFTGDDSSTATLRRFVRESGYHAHGWRLGANTGPTEATLGGMRDRVRRLVREHGQPISLLGWSLGGIYARELGREFPEEVRSVITLGTPFRLGRNDHTIASDQYERLAKNHVEPPEWWADEETRPRLTMPVTAIYTRTDRIVPWRSCVEDDGPLSESIEVFGSHSGLGHNPAALIAIADRLSQVPGQWRRFRPPASLRALYPLVAHG